MDCVALAVALGFPSTAFARSAGAPFQGCSGCHGGEAQAWLTLVPDGPLTPGESMDFTLTVRSDGIARAGFFATADGLGTFTPGAGNQLVGSDLTHQGPTDAHDGEAQFRFSWTPPPEPDGGDIYVFALAANGNGQNTGDVPGQTKFSFAWGCEPVPLFADFDRDGYGTAEQDVSVGCGDRDGWSSRNGDCNAGNDEIHPGAPEQCNGRDDDCDGEVDENAEPFRQYPDLDGDGYGDPSGVPVMGCALEAGLALSADDCDDANSANHPGAEEVCDGQDNDCNGRIDEGARPRCGVGWCERLAPSCFDGVCSPGEPNPEVCNGVDDDCDGEVDEGDVCPAGRTCFMFQCVATGDAAGLDPTSNASSGAASADEVDSGLGGAPAGSIAGQIAMETSSSGGVPSGGGSFAVPQAAGSGPSPSSSGSVSQPESAEAAAAPSGGCAVRPASSSRRPLTSLPGIALFCAGLFTRRRQFCSSG